MKNGMQLKAVIKKAALDMGIAPQSVLQTYMFERVLERIARSSYSNKFIIKGGMLIAAIVGLDSRSTMDMDATLKGISLNENSVRDALYEIFAIELDDNIVFSITGIEAIREDDVYGGFRATFIASFDKLNVVLKMDLTTGDIITPREIDFSYPMMFKEGSLELLAYNLETILAEKYETVIRKSTLNTRTRDFYDIYILVNIKLDQINGEILKQAITLTARKRESIDSISDSKRIIPIIAEDEELKRRWKLYQKEFTYAVGIEWKNVMESVEWISSI